MNFYQFSLFTLLLVAALFCAGSSASSADCDVKGHKFNKGETYEPIGECVQYTCDGKEQLHAKGCAVEHTLKPCTFIPTDTTKPYPDCCPKHDC